MRNVFIIILLSVCYAGVGRVDGQELPEKNAVVSLSDSAVEALYAEGKGLFLQKEYARAAEKRTSGVSRRNSRTSRTGY